jgi:hypothetical protein
MSFYPVLTAPGCNGQTTLYNFPPNDWEEVRKECRFVNLTWAQEGAWHSISLGKLDFGAMTTYTLSDLSAYLPNKTLPLLSLASTPFPARSKVLPLEMLSTNMPNWRATLALVSPLSSTCYLGELDPFPAPGSMLTFPPFLQFGSGIENYMLFLNFEKSPQSRAAFVEIYDCALPKQIKGKFEVHNNAISAISLDNLGFSPEDLPVIVCKGMSGIPLFFSKTHDGAWMSLEHTHPPASSVVHGKRWEAQKMLKNVWISSLGMT